MIEIGFLSGFDISPVDKYIYAAGVFCDFSITVLFSLSKRDIIHIQIYVKYFITTGNNIEYKPDYVKSFLEFI